MLTDFFTWQFEELNSVIGWLAYAGVAALGLAAMALLYKFAGREFIDLDGVFSKFEKDFWRHALTKYFFWGLVQQGLIIIISVMLYTLGVPVQILFVLSILIFSVGYHTPNVPLVMLTAIMGTALYFVFFVLSCQNIIALGMVHGILGTAAMMTGMDMRVWCKHPYWQNLREMLDK